MKTLLIYGSYGYTGELIVEKAVAAGLKPILSGRRREALQAQAEPLGLQFRVADVNDSAQLDQALAGVDVVLHCAGPFSKTAKSMMEACIRNRAHYLDITGEIAVFELGVRLGHKAEEAGIAIFPGVGFDVVPSDCLAAHLKKRLPTATHLSLGFQALGGTSHGTASTMVENIDQGGAIRRDGKIVQVPSAYAVRTIDFGRGPTGAVTIPWGDVSTAFQSTQIPNIQVFIGLPRASIRGLQLSRYLQPLLKLPAVKRFLQSRVDAAPRGPTPEQRARGKSLLWGEATDSSGKTVVSRLKGPEGYTLTADSAVLIAQKALNGELRPGFLTPSLAFGPDFVLQLPGVTREDLP